MKTKKTVRVLLVVCGLLLGMALGRVSVSASAAATLGRVTGIKQTKATETSVTVTWNQVKGATHYGIYDAETDEQLTVVSRNKVIIDNKLEPGKVYSRYYIRALCYANNRLVNTSRRNSANFRFKTVPGAIPGFQARIYTSASRTLLVAWKKVASADGYQVRAYSLKTKKKLGSTVTVSKAHITAKLPGIASNQSLKLEIRAYTVIDGKKRYGSWMASYTAMVNEISVKRTDGKHEVEVRWKKVAKVSEYDVYISTNYLYGYKAVAVTQDNKIAISKIGGEALKVGQRYYVRIVPRIQMYGISYPGLESKKFFRMVS